MTKSKFTRFMTANYLTIICFLLAFHSNAQSSEQLHRTPAISPSGQQIAFSHQGDIWTVATTGGTARRLTIHEAYEINPTWANDNTLIYESNRFGHSDIFVNSPLNSQPKRLTYHSAGNHSPKTNGKQIVFSTNRLSHSLDWSPEIYVTSLEGGTPQIAAPTTGYNPNPSPNGRYIAYERGPCKTSRVDYKGAANRDIWVYDSKKKTHTQITTFEGQDIQANWGKNNELYFLRATNGIYNLFSISLKNGTPSSAAKQITKLKKEGIRSFHTHTKTNLAILEIGSSLHSINLEKSSKPKKINIITDNDYHFYPSKIKSFSGKITDYDLSPDEKYLAATIHGEVFIKAIGEKRPKAKNLSNHAYRDNQVQWLNDSVMIMSSDRSGHQCLYTISSSDEEQKNMYKTYKIDLSKIYDTGKDVNRYTLSHKRDKIAILEGRSKLIIANIDSTGKLDSIRTMLDGWATPNGIAWSPDDRWLAYSLNDLDFNSEIYIHSVKDFSVKRNVSMHPRPDSRPVWSPDGSKLGFLSKRNNDDWDVWFAWLNKEDWQKSKEDWEELSWNEDKKDKKDSNDSTKKETIYPIDLDGIHNRLVQVTSLVGNEDDLLISEDGEEFYFTSVSGVESGKKEKYALYQIKWDGSDAKKLLDTKRMWALKWNKKYSSIYYLAKGGKLNYLDIKSKKSKGESISAKLKINTREEFKQVFNEAWRALRDGFYDPEFHGKDWAKMKTAYFKKTTAAANKQEFRLLFNEMLGELNASHMGLYGGNQEKTQKQKTGLLGINVTPNKKGLLIKKILKDSPASHKEGLQLNDIILSINGQSINKKDNIYEYLNGQAGEKLWIEIERKGERMDIYLRPTNSLRKQKYEAWVNWQKELTDKYSNGKLGYIHIQGMDWRSFERFQRELTASGQDKEGIVIDVRNNGGGWTTDMLMAVLNVKQHAYTIPRGATNSLKNHKKFKSHYPFGERLPFPPLLKPTITLCNESSYSNAEIFSHAYKHLKIGQLVGVPTFGAVISTGGKGLLDGSFVRMPFRAWYALGTDKNMEWDPAIPDVIIHNAPDFIEKNQDAQLKKAVELLIKE